MRPHGQTKLGFFPLPIAEARRLKSWLSFPERFSALDPCVGDGVAFAHLLEGTQARGYGIEIDSHRAEQAARLGTLRQASRRSWRIGQRRPVRVKFLCYEGTMQTSCLRLMGKKLLVALTMEGKFAGEGLQSIDEDDDMLSAMARELVERNGIGETADSVWKALNTEQKKLFPTASLSEDEASSIEIPGILLETESDPASLVEGAMDTTSVVVFGQRSGALSARKRRARPIAPNQGSLFSSS